MESVLRGAVVYVLVWLVLRVSGKRTLSEASTFDLVLLLIISETTQQAMIRDDYSITNAFLLIVTLVGIDILTSVGKQRWPAVQRLMDGLPVVIVRDGRPLRDCMDRLRIDDHDVLAAARQLHGLERLDQVKYAVLESNGRISIVPR